MRAAGDPFWQGQDNAVCIAKSSYTYIVEKEPYDFDIQVEDHKWPSGWLVYNNSISFDLLDVY